MLFRTKQFILGLCLISVSTVFSYSCKSSKPNDHVTAVSKKSEPLAKSLLWKIEGNGLAQPSYLFGTIHIINEADYFLPKGTLQAFGESEQVYFEINMAEMNDIGAMMGILPKTFMADGLTLKDLLNDADYAVVEDHFQKMGMPLFLLERIKPMFLSIFAMGGDFDMGGIQIGSLKSYEMEFMKLAEDSDKPTGGLETIEFQMSVFDSIPYKDQAAMLVDMIQRSDEGSDQFEEMTKMYLTQDIESMVTTISEDPSGLGNYEDVLLRKRNEAWIPIIQKQANLKTTFFAVGAGHLAGEYGVIKLLQKAGFKLTPLSVESKK